MMNETTAERLREWAAKYNDIKYFTEDPIAFPREFIRRGAGQKDIEIAALFAAHFAWGRRSMIVRDLERFFDYLEWKPLDYVLSQDYRDDDTSIHRTIKWKDTAAICAALRTVFSRGESLSEMDAATLRSRIFGSAPDPNAANKKIHLMRRWMVRRDGKVDLGLWKNISPAELIIPLDVHVHTQAVELGLTDRKSKDYRTALQITRALEEVFPYDPCLGDYALFGYGVSRNA